MNKKLFYILSFTWGLPVTILGVIGAAALICMGYKPKVWGYCVYFNIGKDWGGLNLGPFFFTDDKDTENTKNHEHGHALQNCIYGFITPFIVHIPSAMRYQYREKTYHKKGLKPPTAYDDVWFEGQATDWGTRFLEYLRR